jgi:hypothetical protein
LIKPGAEAAAEKNLAAATAPELQKQELKLLLWNVFAMSI